MRDEMKQYESKRSNPVRNEGILDQKKQWEHLEMPHDVTWHHMEYVTTWNNTVPPGIYGTTWYSMELHVAMKDDMKHLRIKWGAARPNDAKWDNMGSHSTTWGNMRPHEAIWNNTEQYDTEWSNMEWNTSLCGSHGVQCPPENETTRQCRTARNTVGIIESYRHS